ncbi:helix-turn-helix transcriptional regulator [Proteiniphilum sp.]|uniref:helix-turn-helix domain-containing protein n=1 Tax=Proteiniphilum sp. TaxID=1926877 RepID=UPI002B206828|nr:helix-turn-helix transcriptional regulator [Proteiniphilum sp.]MEA4916373.1 helix-turn-helix transcriptional regulator [Proteiniphilum sp.]
MEFIERLKLFIKSKGLGQTKFEELVGFSRGYISKVKTSIGADKLSNIVEVFPDLNLDWLITGKGKMIGPPTLSDPAEQVIVIEEEDDAVKYKNKYLETLEENRLLRIEIENLRKIIDTKKKESHNTGSQ